MNSIICDWYISGNIRGSFLIINMQINIKVPLGIIDKKNQIFSSKIEIILF